MTDPMPDALKHVLRQHGMDPQAVIDWRETAFGYEVKTGPNVETVCFSMAKEWPAKTAPFDHGAEEGLKGHDPAAPPESGFLTPATSQDIEHGHHTQAAWKQLASFTAEQTAEFLRGGDIGRPTYHDPETALRMEAQRTKLRRCVFDHVVPALINALEPDSHGTAVRLHHLSGQARGGDAGASRLLGAMIGELLGQGLQP